ncbi:chemotaxis protein [Burkholderia pseudomallei]|nr:chemotaxis protein [Burkholderia pseudomallei]
MGPSDGGRDMGSTLNPDDEPREPGERSPSSGDSRTLGSSDSSDSGSDVAGARRRPFDVDTELDNHALETGDAELDSDTDRSGTGERASADGDSTFDDSADIEPDRTERVPRTKRGDD